MEVRKLPASRTYQHRWEVTGESDSEYVVACKATGEWGCSCPAWKFQRQSRGECKHIEFVRNEVLGQEKLAISRGAVMAHYEALCGSDGVLLPAFRAAQKEFRKRHRRTMSLLDWPLTGSVPDDVPDCQFRFMAFTPASATRIAIIELSFYIGAGFRRSGKILPKLNHVGVPALNKLLAAAPGSWQARQMRVRDVEALTDDLRYILPNLRVVVDYVREKALSRAIGDADVTPNLQELPGYRPPLDGEPDTWELQLKDYFLSDFEDYAGAYLAACLNTSRLSAPAV